MDLKLRAAACTLSLHTSLYGAAIKRAQSAWYYILSHVFIINDYLSSVECKKSYFQQAGDMA